MRAFLLALFRRLVRWLEPDGGRAPDAEQLQVQLAGCLTAAEGHAGTNPPKKGDWAWSPAFQAVLDLREEFGYVKKIASDLQDASALQRAATPGPRETKERS